MNQRYYSLDVFRGATVAFMILVNNPGSWKHIYAPLDHAHWNGCTPTDLVFPFFLFAVGNAMAFVMPKFDQAGTSFFLSTVTKRTLFIFFIGLFLNWSPFVMWQNDTLVFKSWEWATDDGVQHGIRILGVLQRIALCYFFASLIVYFFKTKGAYVSCIALLLSYWGLCYMLGTKEDPYSLNGFFGTHLDKTILGEAHMYHGEGVAFDPEGLGSLMAAIVQVVIGFFAGQYIQQKGKTNAMLKGLLIAGAALTATGLIWDFVFPINKKIWTSSYTIYTSGLAIITLSLFIFLIEFKNYKGAVTSFFNVFGKNPLFIFVLSGLLPRLLGLIRISNGISGNGKAVYVSPFGWFYEYVCKNIATNLKVGSLFYALCMIAFYWLIVYILHRKKIYIRV